MTHILNWIHTHKTITWILIFAYTLIVTFPHLIVQDALVIAVGKDGFPLFYQRMAIGAFVFGGIATILYLNALKTNAARRDLLLSWALTLGLVLLAWRFFSVNNSELIHFAQYAIPGVILLAVTRSVTDALAWIIIMAGFDEGYQFWGIHPDWGIPWDFNDIVMDLLGGALGVLFSLGFLPLRPTVKPNWLRPGIAILGATYVSLLLLLATGLALLYEDKANTTYWFSLSRMKNKGFWFFDETWGPRTIHSLTPPEGLILIVVLLAAYSLFDRRHEVLGS
jgi:hypothetical protein